MRVDLDSLDVIKSDDDRLTINVHAVIVKRYWLPLTSLSGIRHNDRVDDLDHALGGGEVSRDDLQLETPIQDPSQEKAA